MTFKNSSGPKKPKKKGGEVLAKLPNTFQEQITEEDEVLGLPEVTKDAPNGESVDST